MLCYLFICLFVHLLVLFYPIVDDLEFYFSHFGKVTEINIKYDPLSCLTRGFCFVTFELEETVNLILKKPIHMIKGKMIELKRAKYRPICKKVFVGGLDPQITENDLKSYFSQYGTVCSWLYFYSIIQQIYRIFFPGDCN